MAQWYLAHGTNPELLNISSTIVMSQTMEIAEMQAILKTIPVPADCMPSAPSPSMVRWLCGLCLCVFVVGHQENMHFTWVRSAS